ncbi:YciI family protein [Actinomadura parmotrematis]|uniref:YciI family protein n=1 Tax=Actinomadura parmotrematis TaxID=2864039 RepID=A0ABS7FVZ5_9ACTN|nr:YciI family protein [Actinomadura parmotrematis]MBW8483608.1 YciI family protein [Actinomadura parmotrematis]
MKHYLLSVMQPEGPRPDDAVLARIDADLKVLNAEMRDAGAWVFSGGLEAPATATVLRAEGGGTVLTDGPYAEAKEYLGGFTIVRAPDLDAALKWGERLAGATTLPIEVRPFHFAEGA